MAFPYKHALVIGATSGIGLGISERLVKEGVKVTVVGRRKERLNEFVKIYGESSKAVQFDIGELDKIPQFAADVLEESPDIDCVFLNAGTQYAGNFAKPETVNLAKYDESIKINYTSMVHLTHAFIPYLITKPSTTAFIFTGTHLAIIPASMIPAYSASKAALNSFTMCIRNQLRNSNIKVVDILPPPVQTELHVDRSFGMPLDEFTEILYNGLVSRTDDIVIGTPLTVPQEMMNEIIAKRRAGFESLAKLMNSMTH